MATKRTARRRAMLMLQAILCALLGASGCARSTEADRRLDKLNGLSGKGGHAVVRARVVQGNPLHYKATDFIDLSAKSDLVLAMLLPAETRDDMSGGYPEICQVQVAENEEATPTLFHIYWVGQGPPVYSLDGSSHRYVRTKMPPSELRRSQHTDESIALCEVIEATIAGDDVRRADWEQALRISNGLEPPD